QLGNDDDVMAANENLADLALVAGRFEEARTRWEKAVGWHSEQRLPEESDCLPRFGLGAVAFHEGRLDDAERDLLHAHELCARAGFARMRALALSGLAAVAAARGEHVEAVRLLGSASELMAATGGKPRGGEATLFEFARASSLDALGEERFEELLEDGRLVD